MLGDVDDLKKSQNRKKRFNVKGYPLPPPPEGKGK